MILHALLLIAMALGQICLAILVVNITHGFANPIRWIERIWPAVDYLVFAVLVGVGLAALAAAWWLGATPWSQWPWPVQAYALVCLTVSLIALPLTTLVRLLRRRPTGTSGQSHHVDLAGERGLETLIGASRRSWWLRLPGSDALSLLEQDWEIELPGLPPSLDGLSLLHLTDTHLAPSYARRFFEAVMERAARQEVDLVLLTGDVVEHLDTIDWIGPLFSGLRGRLGQFAILGNHDLHFEPQRITAELERAGFTMIDGSWARIETGGAALAIGGTSYPWGPALDPNARPESDFALLLSHTPDLFYRAAGWGMDLMLSGHNHGGQVRLPIIGPVLMPSRYSRRFDRGFFRQGRTLMYVSQGIGAKHPLRVNCPPEITRLVLRCPQALAAEHAAEKRSGQERTKERWQITK